MKLIHYLYIAPLAFLAACSSEEPTIPADTGHPNGAIELSAGIVEGGSSAVTRAGAEDHHSDPGHLNLGNGTALALRVSGTWTGHDPVTVVKTTTATVGTATGADNKHNALSCSPVLYWDDYGTADPGNKTTGRAEGLTIYGAAINGQTTVPSDLSSINGVTTESAWTGLSWTLPANQTSGWSSKDLLISNNLKAANNQSPDVFDNGTYKFDQFIDNPTTYTKLLEFTHALSKITVNLKAGAGFANGVFANNPEVTLTSNKANATTETEWAFITGTVNVTTGGVDVSAGTRSAITMYQAATAATGYNVTKEALVMPGSEFTSDASDIIRINADGNVYYVQASDIRTAALGKGHTAETGGEILTKAGYNYIINVTVNKTDIVVTATVTNWENVEAAEVEPVINVDANFGVAPTNETVFNKDEFSFYRRTSAETTYSDGLAANGFYPEIRRIKKDGSKWTMNVWSSTANDWEVSNLYWPDHNTHYQFRGVWPCTGTETGERTYPRVEMVNNEQVIKVQNVAYAANSFPSDLQIGRPDVAENATCTNHETGHTTTNLWSGGICATEGKVNIKFKYMMSQVEVNLSTTGASAPDRVELENAIVELVNVHKTGNVSLDDRTVTTTGITSTPTPAPATDTFGDYILDNYTYNSETRTANYHSAIVPQPLTYTSAQAAGNVKFRITITNTNGTVDTSDDTTDVYYADVEPIKETGKSTKVAPNSAWESGYHYIYNLKLSKTEVKVTATLANWITVNANENVWF